MNYTEFLNSKKDKQQPCGVEIQMSDINPMLFDFQKVIVRWALKRGKAAIWADCGLGKSFMQLEWASHIPGNVFIIAPLSVGHQTVREGEKLGIKLSYKRHQDEIEDRITITNYEMVDHFDQNYFNAVILDESSILKSFDAKYRTKIINQFGNTPYKLACTATPSPNDFVELGNHAEFLNICSYVEMLSTYFVHDGGETSNWRLKGHAKKDFWKWVSSWAIMLRKPSDLGFSDKGFELPRLNYIHVPVVSKNKGRSLFNLPAVTLQERIKARRDTVEDRVKCASQIIQNKLDEPWIVWCNLNEESQLITESIGSNTIEVKGSDKYEYKEMAIQWFLNEKCICNESLFRAKLAIWPKDQKVIGKNIITNIENSGLPNQLPFRKNILNGGENICENMQEKIHRNSEKHWNSEQDIMKKDVKNMQKMKKCEQGIVHMHVNGNDPILKNVLHRTSKDLVSLQTNTGKYSPNKMKVVPYAVQKVVKTNEQADSTLTIATNPDVSEDCFAPHATSDLENSQTTPISSKRPLCICGCDLSQRKILISKSTIFGYGLNLQHCNNILFLGLNDSFEQMYQAIRRCWRFGQKKEVNCYIVTSDREQLVVENIRRKERDSEIMMNEMRNNMESYCKENIQEARKETDDYKTDYRKGNAWQMYKGDSCEVIKEIPDNSIHYSIFSPPFASLYTYSNSERDMGNSKDYNQFFTHFQFLVKELYRVIMPGRLLSFHCMNIPTLKSRQGFIGIQDFRGDLIRLFQNSGFIYHSEVVIWKDPVIAMQRTKALGLLHKQLKKDSCMSRQGIPDYLVTMRKPGDNPEPVTHTDKSFPVGVWQNYASPVWMDINASDTLQYISAREHEDERHICPLQLEVIRRSLRLWTNECDVVLSPFAGIGSEGYCSLEIRRKFIGIELKTSYYDQACKNLKNAENKASSNQLFDVSKYEIQECKLLVD